MNTPVPPSNAVPTRQRKRMYLLLIPVVLIVSGLWLHVHRLHQSDVSPSAEIAPWAVRTDIVAQGVVSGSIQSAAIIEAPNIITLSPQIQGTVTAIGPRAGVEVKRGELLVRIDARTIASNIASLEQQRQAARANADYATKQQARTDTVLAEGGVSQAQADQARTATDAAQASVQALSDQIAALRVNLGYGEIRSPQNAMVANRLIEIGGTAEPGKPLYQLTSGKGAVVRMGVSTDQLAEIKLGDTLQLSQGGNTLALSIKRISPVVNASGLGTVEADAPSAPFGLPSGSTVAATLITQANVPAALTVPMSALVGSSAAAHVLVFVSPIRINTLGRLRLVPVKVLQQGANHAAVQGALQPGEQVVVGQTAVLAQMRDGDTAVTTTDAWGAP